MPATHLLTQTTVAGASSQASGVLADDSRRLIRATTCKPLMMDWVLQTKGNGTLIDPVHSSNKWCKSYL
jgi:hypothetical protein